MRNVESKYNVEVMKKQNEKVYKNAEKVEQESRKRK